MQTAIAQHTTSGMTMITTRTPTPRPTAAAQNSAHSVETVEPSQRQTGGVAGVGAAGDGGGGGESDC